jgi:iron complex transport system substrate-binding protein
MVRFLTLLSLTCLSGCKVVVADVPPNAVVSTTLCVDTYVLALPDLEQRLAALSWQSRSSLSRTPEHLRHLPQADEDPERLHRWKAATIISSAGQNGDLNLSFGDDFETVWKNFELLSKSLDIANPTQAFKDQLNNLPQPTISPRLLYLNRAGMTAGRGTFVDAVFQAAGAENIIRTSGWHSPDAETLLTLNPDAIVTSFMSSNYVGVNDRAVRHAALAKKIEAYPKIDIHGGLWPCAGPGLIEAATHLSSELTKL